MNVSGASGVLFKKSQKEEGVRNNERPSTNSSINSSKVATASENNEFRAAIGLPNLGRRTLGIILLLVTVFLWTGSNFLASVSRILHCWIWVELLLTLIVHFCRWYLFKAILCYVCKYGLFCRISNTNASKVAVQKRSRAFPGFYHQNLERHKTWISAYYI